MPRVVDCEQPTCFLKTPTGMDAKFCQECGASAATKVAIVKATCPSCKAEIEDSARFCPECGTRVQSAEEASRLEKLLKGHKRPTEVTTGRGLSAEELAQMEASIRTPSRVADPTRQYEVDPEHAKIMGIQVPGSDSREVELAKGRTAIQNPEGKHIPGGLSADKTVPADYTAGVRVIPYKFRNAARRGSTLVEDTRGGPAPGDAAFFSDEAEADPFFIDAPVKPKRSPKKATKAQKTAAIQNAKPPADPVVCHECGRFVDNNGNCMHCLDQYSDALSEENPDPLNDMSVEELANLWKNTD